MPIHPVVFLRRARPEDVEQVHRVHSSAIRAGGGEVYSQEVVETWAGAFNPESFPRNVRRMEFWIAEVPEGALPPGEEGGGGCGSGGGKGPAGPGGTSREREPGTPPATLIAAFLALDVEARELESLYVAPLGQGLGLGTRLLTFAEDLARRHGLSALWLDASLNSVAFYQKHGWKAVREHSRIRAGVEIPLVRMEKELTG